jgi:FkbM family methyltransferase
MMPSLNRMDTMASFTLRGITLDIPDADLRGGLDQALSSGRYEGAEADAIQRHLRPGDRFVDLGAGAGYLCCLAARMLGEAAVTGVEAAPATASLARGNLARNGLTVTVLDGAVVADGHPGDTVAFGVRPAFWASALQGAGDWPPNAVVATVPALRIGSLLAKLRPTVLCCDIEGAEADVLATDLRGVRLIVVEIHPAIYGPSGTKRLFDGLSAQGFAYTPHGSRGTVVVFERVGMVD